MPQALSASAPAQPAPTVTAPIVRTADFPGVNAQPGAPALDAERLAVYHLALELQVLASSLVPSEQRVLRDQIERASVSTVLCIAEGAGRRSRRDKRHYVTTARGSAMETAAAIDILRVRQLASAEACGTARSLAVRVVQCLTKLHEALA